MALSISKAVEQIKSDVAAAIPGDVIRSVMHLGTQLMLFGTNPWMSRHHARGSTTFSQRSAERPLAWNSISRPRVATQSAVSPAAPERPTRLEDSLK
jgi:hypothetical protein